MIGPFVCLKPFTGRAGVKYVPGNQPIYLPPLPANALLQTGIIAWAKDETAPAYKPEPKPTTPPFEHSDDIEIETKETPPPVDESAAPVDDLPAEDEPEPAPAEEPVVELIDEEQVGDYFEELAEDIAFARAALESQIWADLRAACVRLGVSAGGNADAIVARLEAHLIDLEGRFGEGGI